MVERETILLHPSQLNNVKRELVREISKKKTTWNEELKGIITKVSHIRLLNGGKALIMDDSPFLHYQVKYTLNYLEPPKVGDKTKAKILEVQKNHISLTLNQMISVIVPTADMDAKKYELKTTEIEKPKDDESEEDLEVSDHEMDDIDAGEGAKPSGTVKYQLYSIKKQKALSQGDKIKIEVKKIIVN